MFGYGYLYKVSTKSARRQFRCVTTHLPNELAPKMVRIIVVIILIEAFVVNFEIKEIEVKKQLLRGQQNGEL